MPEVVLVALITGVASIITNMMINNKNRALIEYRLDQIELKQDKHNSLIERVYKIEGRQSVMDEQITVANHRIQELEKGVAKE